MRTIVGSCVLLTLLSACTSLSVTQPPDPASAPTHLTAGFIYHTPAALISPVATVTIKDCPVDTTIDKALHHGNGVKPITQVSFSVTGDMTTEIVPDRPIAIDYRRLKTFLKTSSISIERYPNGTLKSVSASIEDQSAEATGDVIAVAGAAALLSTGVGAAAVLPAAAGLVATGAKDRHGAPIMSASAVKYDTVTFVGCSADTTKAIADRLAATKARDTATDSLNAATAQLNSVGAASGTSDAAAAKQVAALKAKIASLTAEVDDKTADINAANAQLSLPLDVFALEPGETALPNGQAISDGGGHIAPSALRERVLFTANPTRLDQFVAKHFVVGIGELADNQIKAFLQRSCLQGDDDPGSATCKNVDQIKTVLANRIAIVHAHGSLVAPMADKGGNQPDAATLASPMDKGVRKSEVAASEGVIYIEPQVFRVRLSVNTIGGETKIQNEKPLKSVDLSVPQLGRYLSLPLEAGFGEKVALSATFGTDGSLITGSYSNPKTMGKSISGALKSAADTAVSTANGIEERKVKLAQDRADILAAQAAAQDSLSKLTPTVDPLSDINAELAKARAQAALEEALLRIKTADAALVGP